MRLVSLTVAAVLLFGGSATAQQAADPNIAIQLYQPAIGVKNTFFSVEGAAVANHLGFGVGLELSYQHRPLVLFLRELAGSGGGGFNVGDAQAVDVVRNHLVANLIGVFGFQYRWLKAQVGIDLPIHLMMFGQTVNDQGQVTGDLEGGSGLGDLRLQLKVLLLDNWKGLSLAFSPILSFPTSTNRAYGGDAFLAFRPRVALDYQIGDFIAAVNIGAIVREPRTFFSSEVGHRLTYGVGAGYQVHKRFMALAELFGQAGFNTKANCRRDPVTGDTVCTGTSSNDLDAFPLELVLGGRVKILRDLELHAGVGIGLIQAVGSPNARAIVGVRWAPDFRDRDGDGIPDHLDKCPTQPEDKDGFQDEDGCPDPDNDGDGIPDHLDKCPNQPEDKDGFQDEDGCPDPDNDGDGIPDLHDACPFEPETKNGYKDEDGCPDEPDKDNDGIPDSKDKCPNEPEDKDGFQDEDGCPDPDNDGDGVPDNLDSCPNEPEDKDGFQDDDGCPDPDNDGDGIPDAKDKCPNEKETINGYKDDDGCPDQGKPQVVVTRDKIVILKNVFFATGRAKIRPVSYSLLNQVALILKAHPKIKGVRIEGHTDNRGNRAYNKKLSQSRAESVRTYLIGRGIAADRLYAMGYGPEKPIAENKSAKGRAKNRRVDFVILDRAPGKAP
jgi:outer membrane protein OmpA-like peptidoglycan-associated protein